MMDDRLDEQLKDLAAEYNPPPETPREEIWAAIQKNRIAYREPRRFGWKPLVWGGLAAAAVLAIGIMIGKGTSGSPGDDVAGAAPTRGPAIDPNDPDRAFKVAAVQYLGETEEFLTVFRADVRQGQIDQNASERARQLLSSNRLLMDSPAAKDPEIGRLLEDLELVLAEISRVSGSDAVQEEAGLIDDGIEEGGLLDRLRTAVPAGTAGIGL
jgi:hypothetical protein